MQNDSNIRKLSSAIMDYYYYIILVIYLMSMYIGSIRVGAFASVLMLLIPLWQLFLNRGLVLRFKTAYLAPLLYFIWCSISIIWFGLSGLGYDVYLQAFSNSLLPMLFTFCYAHNEDRFWTNVLYSYNIAGLIGTFFLIVKPAWYVRYCLSMGFDYRRLSFAYGSIIMGTMGAVAVIIALRLIITSNGKKGKLQYLLTCLFAFLSMQRSAWLVVTITLVIAHYYIFFKLRAVKMRFLLFELIGLIAIVTLFGNQIMEVFNSWMIVRQLQYGGSITVENTINERSYQWARGIENSNLFLGSGFGSRGHKAAAAGIVNYVADGNWVLILCESGILGLILFIYVCFKTIRKGVRNFRKLFLPLGVIFAFMFQAIGSNVWEQQLIAPLFWFAIGQILCYEPDQEKI